ncbi:fungal-specific transcription factor domain-containing protein [Halteromyces radiatus]|uniref:fungal-specific transcription factor domain-containing protein n=1 Tax=Halteromyces radiatus TaxID=101107 RepID=UPI00221EA660|nr:fungal-specific transcription factor domain-containing protein [Halteromyces radiatus]KAI8097393.1 fungal-specific transcription factor domain-containing protein [Halteromyces radiatus]
MFSFDQAGQQQENNNNNNNPEPVRPKRPRSSLACIRCRKKKVKCDFVQPTCGRCSTARLPCSYATPPRRVDGQAFDLIGNHVEELKERIQKMQSELVMMKSNLHPFSGGDYLSGPTVHRNPHPFGDTRQANHSSSVNDPASSSSMFESQNQPQQQQQLISTAQQPVTWKLSLSPSGLRIDTNIASVADLYRILLNGISQLNISGDSATTWGRYAKYRSFGNRSASSTQQQQQQEQMDTSDGNNVLVSTSSGIANNSQSSAASSPGRLWEVNETEARIILQEKQPDDTMNQETLNNLIRTSYHSCFLAYQIADQKTFVQLYENRQSGLDPLLLNSINAWLSKHGCVYHGACPDKDPSTMGETYFKNARQLLKKCFDISSPNTIHALINLYMYQLSCERSSLAYLYIGLAIRMAQDLKFHKKEFMPADPTLREANKRLWWTAYWLDLCAALESNRPTMVDDKDCDLEYPVKLDCEDDETGYRIGFAVNSIKLMKVRKDITKHLPSEQSGQSLLSAISRLENALTSWFQDLPMDLRFESDEAFHTTSSFRDEACLILNIQYQTTWIMLHKFFLPKKNQTATPVALLSLNICTKSANFITKMLDIYRSKLPWCQFFYAIDGVIASVTIHQVNAISTEEEVAHLAQRNLIVTADILRQSPLIYMEKINEIVESIEDFLKKNNLATNLQNLPAVNEDSINQQCLSSVFHPTVFDQNEIPVNKNNSNSSISSSPSSSTFISEQSQQQRHSNPAFGTPSSMMTASTLSTGSQPVPPHQRYLHNQQQQHSPLSLSTSPFTPVMDPQSQQQSSMALSTPSSSFALSSSPSPSVNIQQQQGSSLTSISSDNNNNNIVFGDALFSDHTLLDFGTSPLPSAPITMGNTTGEQEANKAMDQFIYGTDMQFINSTLQNNLQHQGNMFNQLGTTTIQIDSSKTSLANNNISSNNNQSHINHQSSSSSTTNDHHLLSISNTPMTMFNSAYLTNSQGSGFGMSSIHHYQQQQQQQQEAVLSTSMESSTSSSLPPSSSTGMFSTMDAKALHDLLYSDATGRQDALNSNLTTNHTEHHTTTISDQFSFGSQPTHHGFMDDTMANMFAMVNSDMNTGQKRVHREWDDAS